MSKTKLVEEKWKMKERGEKKPVNIKENREKKGKINGERSVKEQKMQLRRKKQRE